MTWARGRAAIVDMLNRRELTTVVADLELALRMLDQAEHHIRSADLLAPTDAYAAYALVHDAIRKALSAMLQAQGLRATTAGGHLAVQQAIAAQFEPTMGALLRPVNRIRTTRHAAEYPTESTYIDEDMVRDDLPHAQRIVEAAHAAVPHLPVFAR